MTPVTVDLSSDDVTVSDNTITGTVAPGDAAEISIDTVPAGATVTVTINGNPVTVADNTFAIGASQSAQTVVVTAAADGYQSSTVTYTANITETQPQPIPSGTVSATRYRQGSASVPWTIASDEITPSSAAGVMTSGDELVITYRYDGNTTSALTATATANGSTLTVTSSYHDEEPDYTTYQIRIPYSDFVSDECEVDFLITQGATTVDHLEATAINSYEAPIITGVAEATSTSTSWVPLSWIINDETGFIKPSEQDAVITSDYPNDVLTFNFKFTNGVKAENMAATTATATVNGVSVTPIELTSSNYGGYGVSVNYSDLDAQDSATVTLLITQTTGTGTETICDADYTIVNTYP